MPRKAPVKAVPALAKLLADVRAKAENGDAQAQFDLSAAFFLGGRGEAKDENGCRK